MCVRDDVCVSVSSTTVSVLKSCCDLSAAQELKQDWTVDSTVDLEDMTWETGNDMLR